MSDNILPDVLPGRIILVIAVSRHTSKTIMMDMTARLALVGPVVVIDGDGCLMMQLGSLVTIGEARPDNLVLIVMNNRMYETSGNQPIPGAETADLVGLAKSAGFRTALRIGDPGTLRDQIAGLIAGRGPTMVALDIDQEEPAAKWPALSMRNQIETVRNALQAGRAP